MPRRKAAPKREILPDPLFRSNCLLNLLIPLCVMVKNQLLKKWFTVL